MNSFERRVERLETRQDRTRHRTWDELNIELLLRAWKIVDEYGDCDLEPKSAALVQRCREHIAKTEAEIVREASHRANPEPIWADNYRWRENMWRQRSQEPYVPPLLNHDIDWEAPSIMQRRAALRAIPEIAALLKQGISKLEMHT